MVSALLTAEPRVPDELRIDRDHLAKVNKYVRKCSTLEAFRTWRECFDFCAPSLTSYADKTHSLHLFEKLTPLLVKTLTQVFPVMMTEFLEMDLESTILVKLKRDNILDDGDFLYNMKSEYWIRENELQKVDPSLPFRSSKFEHEEFFLVKFDKNQDKETIDTIEDNNHVRMSSERMEQQVSDESNEKRQEMAMTDKIKTKMDNFIQQMNVNLGNRSWKEKNMDQKYFFPVTPRGLALNTSIRMHENFYYEAFKIDPSFKVPLDLSANAYKDFQETYSRSPEAVSINFFFDPQQDEKIDLINDHRNGKSLIVLNNQSNVLYLESLARQCTFWVVLILVTIL